MECQYEYLLVWVGEIEGLFVKPSQILMHGLRRALENIKQSCRGNIYVLTRREMMDCLSRQIFVT